MPTIQIIDIEDKNRVIDRTPRISWTFVDTYTSHYQGAYRISIYRNATSSYITPSGSDNSINVSGILYAEYSRSNKDASGTYFHDITTPLEAGLYTVYVSGQDTFDNTWATPVSTTFTIVKCQENIIRFSKNDVDEDTSFAKYFSRDNIDITTNPERAKLSEKTHTVYKDGFIILQSDGGYDNLEWDSVTYSASLPAGTSLSLKVRSHNDLTALNSADWSDDISSGSDLVYPNQVHLTGRYIQVEIDIKTDILSSATPVLNYLTMNYTLPTSAEVTYTLDIEDFTIVSNNYSFNMSGTTTNADKKLVIAADPAKTINVYNSEGYDIIKVELDIPVNFQYLSVVEEKPLDSDIKYQFKAFSDPEDEPVVWSTATSSVASLVSIQESESSILHIKINFEAASGDTDTPRLKTMYLIWENYLNPGISYFYSFNYLLDSNLKKVILTANDNISSTKNCKIKYGICCTNSVDFTDYQEIPKNRLVELITQPGDSIRIGAKMISGSLVFLPVIDELGFIIEDVDSKHIYLNN